MWFQTAVSAISALFGGFIGGWVVAFRLGLWRQRVEDQIESIEDRLLKGDPHIEDVPVLRARVDLVLEEVRAIKAEMRRDRERFVTHSECERRHESDARA